MIGGLLALVTPGQVVPLPWASIGGVLLLAYLFSLLAAAGRAAAIDVDVVAPGTSASAVCGTTIPHTAGHVLL
jgi:hypothetical protein